MQEISRDGDGGYRDCFAVDQSWNHCFVDHALRFAEIVVTRRINVEPQITKFNCLARYVGLSSPKFSGIGVEVVGIIHQLSPSWLVMPIAAVTFTKLVFLPSSATAALTEKGELDERWREMR